MCGLWIGGRWDVLPVGVDWWPVVSSLDTLPAVSLCRGLCRSDGLPVVVVVSSLGAVCRMCCLWLLIGGRWDVLPVCEPVPLSVPSVVLCWMVCLLDGLPVAVDWWPLGCAACP